jgi:molybdate transport system substrate-binding protein
MKKILVLSVLLASLLFVFGVQAQEGRTLTVFAAASLTDAFEEMGTAFEASNTGVEVLYNFASSSDLATQIVEGAPADVFASANNTQMTVARDAERIAGTPRTFARNRLVLIVPADNPANITSLRDLANPGVQLLVAAPDVPVRTYTDTMLERLAADAAYGEAYREAFIANIVSEEQNVRQVSAKIALSEGDAGIVYISDVTPEIGENIITIPIPDELNTIATYPIAATTESANPELAQAFIEFVLSDAGQDIMTRWNFGSARSQACHTRSL